ncbi:pilus assembly protein TadG-related protein [Halomonas korlensis]|nr:pilus assembly protein TadG-related protein [Halomonas korlensis]
MVLFAVSLFVLLGFTALAVDGGNLYVARNELQNAADAGALAGARMLYLEDGSSVNDGIADPTIDSANKVATDAAQANDSQKSAVEVVSALRGHWSFSTRTFTPNDSPYPVDLFNRTTQELDLDIDFINAVEVVTAREQTKVEAFFGQIFGFDGYEVQSRAVAYIGFAGALRPEDTDQPIAMCKQALQDGEEYSCDVGRFIPEGDQTGGWTNFEHDDSGASSASDLKDLVCGDGNPEEMRFGEDISTINGQAETAYKLLYDCWVEKTNQQEPWSMALPVIDCEGGVSPKNPLVGAVELNVVWITASPVSQIDNLPTDKNPGAPTQMAIPSEDTDSPSPGTWTSNDPSGLNRWSSFVDEFNLRESDGQLAEWHDKSIYFLPSCSYHEPKGQTGGENFGILARIPVLVD